MWLPTPGDGMLTPVKQPTGPFFDDLTVGQVLDPAPAMTIGPGEAATYQAICGDPLATSLSSTMAEAVTGNPGMLVNPALVMHTSIGQSTVATRAVIANLFYRGVALQRAVRHGETLETTVQILGLRQLTHRPDRPPRGLALLGIRTACVDNGEPVVEYERCAMLHMRHPEAETGNHDDLGDVNPEVNLADWTNYAPADWNPSPLTHDNRWETGTTRTDPLRDTVTSAPELARLTQNLAPVHRDPATGSGQRLVYGGHTIGLAQASLNRVMPANATILGWQACDHTGPVHEGDVLSFNHTLIDEQPAGAGNMRSVQIKVEADRDGNAVPVLDWHLVVWGA